MMKTRMNDKAQRGGRPLTESKLLDRKKEGVRIGEREGSLEDVREGGRERGKGKEGNGGKEGMGERHRERVRAMKE